VIRRVGREERERESVGRKTESEIEVMRDSEREVGERDI
jgi:hypothetical protein